jgi:hypothetical protein
MIAGGDLMQLRMVSPVAHKQFHKTPNSTPLCDLVGSGQKLELPKAIAKHRIALAS